MASSLQKGINAAKTGQMQNALEFLKDAIIEEPQNADVWVWIAAIIDDLDKQEVFLEKALALDPDNVPAQRGMAYLKERKRNKTDHQGDHLSDYTHPISPFSKSEIREGPRQRANLSKKDSQDLGITSADTPNPPKRALNLGIFSNGPKLSPLEIALLAVVMLVFCVIGLLAASALFEFDLPLAFLKPDQPKLTAAPPYPGVFLFADAMFFDMQASEGIPTPETGLPSSQDGQPMIVLWETDINPNQLSMIHENGELIPFQVFQGKDNTDLIQPENTLKPGLCCLTKLGHGGSTESESFWCFQVLPNDP